MYEQRYFLSGDASGARGQLWRTPSLSGSVVQSTRSSSTDSEERIDQSRDAILGRVDLILGQALSASTWSS